MMDDLDPNIVDETAEEIDTIDEVLVLDEVADPNLHFDMWEPTGVVEVDTILENLSTLSDLPLDQHAGVLTSIHEGLRERLAQADGERTA